MSATSSREALDWLTSGLIVELCMHGNESETQEFNGHEIKVVEKEVKGLWEMIWYVDGEKVVGIASIWEKVQ